MKFVADSLDFRIKPTEKLELYILIVKTQMRKKYKKIKKGFILNLTLDHRKLVHQNMFQFCSLLTNQTMTNQCPNSTCFRI